jgi:hypothetical protein
MQKAHPDQVLDPASANAQSVHLAARDDSVLAFRQP